jgi:hypothetical protein
MPARDRLSPSLVVVTATFIALSAILVGCSFFVIISERIKAFQSDAIATAVTVRVNGVQLSFARALYEDWQALTFLAARIDPSKEVSVITAQLDAIVDDGDRVSWGGYARVDGTVQAASRNMLVQADVSRRPWFQRGLEGPFAGDLHEAVLLAKLIGTPGGEPPRFIDLAVPVQDKLKITQGVLGLHINFDWARRYLAETAAALSVDIFLVNRQGEIIIASDGQSYGRVDVPSIRTAQTGVSGTMLETWPDGKHYFSAAYPEVTYKDLPSFGWSIVGRIPATAVMAPQALISKTLVWSLATVGAMLLLLSLLFIQSFIVPVRALARSAQKIAEGRGAYPYETSRTSEYQMIGAALARLQTLTSERD